MGARADAISGLTNLGFTLAIARTAVDAARVEDNATLEQLIREALRRCRRPS